MSNAIIQSKLIRAQQALIQSSNSYDEGCILLKEAIDMLPDPYQQMNTKSDISKVINQTRKETAEACLTAFNHFVFSHTSADTAEKVMRDLCQ